MNKKFDEIFEIHIYQQLLLINVIYPDIDVKKWAHVLSYTGGVDIDDKESYQKKLTWMISGSPLMTSYMRSQMYKIAEYLHVPELPKTFKVLGIYSP